MTSFDATIYVNEESAFPEELARPVKDGDELHIVTMIAGG
ncbi:MAG: MoaD/ThiS family protein [Chloroflexi bacterium]|nr:MoaD/ThiS family protein [Chloroflexota bacterium]